MWRDQAGCTGACFFFSSRRRHTRCSRDWSSDVCSSDLNAEAQYLLAVLYLNGLIAARDATQARTWLEKSATQGSAQAAFSLANLLASSEPPDTEGAQRWLKRARELGYTPAAQTGAREGLAVWFHPQKDLTHPAAQP